MSLFSKKNKNKEEKKEPQTVSDEKSQVKTSGKEITENTKTIKPVARGIDVLSLKKPFITEKSGLMMSQNKYVFLVNPRTNRHSIKKAIESFYDVKVKDVNIICKKGKSKKLGFKQGKQAAIKKAIVTLKAGEKIEL
ncbi:MAG: 50S ribosomal protein L23 [Minisyncoccia bacterium]